MVYSTCSLTRRQNEDVVQWLLATAPNAKLVPVHFGEPEEVKESVGEGVSTAQTPWHAGTIPHTLRFSPHRSHTSGLFIAKFQKLDSVGAGAAATAT